MAGGKGTRIADIANDIPKAMIPICNKTILEHQLECLKKNNITDIILVIGHLGHYISDYFEDGSKIGVNISYYTETEPLGTAGAIYKIENLTDDFILINGDIIFDMDFSRMIDFHKDKKAMVTLAVHPNDHPFDSALLITDKGNRVIKWMNKEEPRVYYKNIVNSGIHILSKHLLSYIKPEKEKIDLDRDMLKPAIDSGRIYAYHTPEYIKDMGTPERFSQVHNAIEKKIVMQKSLRNRQKAVFLDRDGTINVDKGFIKSHEDFILLQKADIAIKDINKLGYLAIVITNQPVIARGEASLEELELIHNKMETELGSSGAFVDDIFFCPHHPDKGFQGELPEYKTVCDCRKPKPGMILEAAKKYNIDLSKSYMIGDHRRDIDAGINAGCTPVYIGKEVHDNIMTFNNLFEFSQFLVLHENSN